MPDIRVLPDINGTGFREMLSFLKECVGIMEGSDSRGEGMVGDMIIFSENAWICDGIPSFDPVYVYYESCAGEVKHDHFFENVVWINGWDADWNGKVIAGIETEKNTKYGSGYWQEEPLKMIMTDDSLVNHIKSLKIRRKTR